MPITVRLRRPHPAQQQILSEARRFNVLAIGRRGGKSALGQLCLAKTALDGKPGAYLAPTYKLLAEFWRELVQVLAPVTRRKLEDEHRLELITGGVIECWSTDTGDPGRGRKYARVVVDEAAMMGGLQDIWNLAVRPTLVDLEGDAWFLSTPKGLNDFYLLWLLGQDELQAEWASWQMPTDVNPYIPRQEIAEARREMPQRAAAQELDAQFLETEGAGVFSGVGAVSRLHPHGPEKGHSYAFGIDWAAGGADWTVISIMDVATRHQVAIDRFTTADFDMSVGRLHALHRIYSPVATLAEQNSIGLPLIQRLQRGWTTALGDVYPPIAIQGWVSTNAAKAAAVEQLAIHIETGEITLLDDATQVGELRSFEQTILPSGLIRYAAPPGGHDDTVIALMLANRASILETGLVRAKYSWNPQSSEFKRAQWSFRR